MSTVYLLIIGGPDATGDLTLQVDLGGPVSLSTDRADQHEPVSVRDEGLGAVVGPREVAHLEGRRFSPFTRFLRVIPKTSPVQI